MKFKMNFGQWIKHEEGSEFFIKEYGNPEHNKEQYERLPAPKIGADGKPVFDLNHYDNMYDTMLENAQVIANSILTDWRGVEDGEGNELPYSTDAAVQVLLQYAEFRTWVVDQSKKLAGIDTEEQEKQEALVKNSKST